MYIGTCRLTYRLHGNDSLKGKRQVSRSLIDRLRGRFNCAVAEVDGIDEHHRLVIGLACISNDPAHAGEMVHKAVRFAESQRIDAELVDSRHAVLEGE